MQERDACGGWMEGGGGEICVCNHPCPWYAGMAAQGCCWLTALCSVAVLACVACCQCPHLTQSWWHHSLLQLTCRPSHDHARLGPRYVDPHNFNSSLITGLHIVNKCPGHRQQQSNACSLISYLSDIYTEMKCLTQIKDTGIKSRAEVRQYLFAGIAPRHGGGH